MSDFRRLVALAGVASAAFGGAAEAQTVAQATGYAVLPRALAPKPPDPGTIDVDIGGLFQWLAGGVAGSGLSSQGQKLSSDATQGFARLFLGMDGQASNAILYGTQFQIRHDFGAPSGGAPSATGTSGSTLYVQTGYAYLGTTSAGTLKVGAFGGPQTAFGYGMFEGFDDGGWNGGNGDLPNVIPGQVRPIFPFADSPSLYTTDKITYYSPVLAGFDFGVSWEPSFVTLNDPTNCTAAALSACDNLASSNVAADSGKRRNTVDAMLRYRGSFGPVGVAIAGGYIGGGVVSETGAVRAGQRYLGLSVASIGTEITYAGLTLGGHYDGGNLNGDWSLRPQGGVEANAYIVGAQYEVGPVVIGASYFNDQSQGDDAAPATEGQRAEYGFAAGGTWLLTPGIGVFLSYLYGARKQDGYDFLAAAPGLLNNQVHAQAAGVGLTVQW